jgi:hypothetical protein
VNSDFTFADVFKLAEETGGETMESTRPAESFALMVEHIRSRYSLHYEAPAAPAGAFRRVRVRLASQARGRHSGARIRARAGYYAIQ